MIDSEKNNDMDFDTSLIKSIADSYEKFKKELAVAIVGQSKVIDQLAISIFSQGHALLVGVPGLAKTLMIRTLASALDLQFSRIQFTPDLMPSDITGTEVIQADQSTGKRTLTFLKGPVFANVILADEINRTPPKTQAALLEAMQEIQVTAGGKKYPLETPFFVLATQNPIEQEGTYPLPEAQLDRFMFSIMIDYPSAAEELEIVKMTTSGEETTIKQVLTKEEILKVQKIIKTVPIADSIMKYALTLVRATRINESDTPDFVKQYIRWGAGPRASQYLIIGAKTHALINGRSFVSLDDIKSIAHPVLRHRIILNYAAESEGITTDNVIDMLLEQLPFKESEILKDDKLPKIIES